MDAIQKLMDIYNYDDEFIPSINARANIVDALISSKNQLFDAKIRILKILSGESKILSSFLKLCTRIYDDRLDTIMKKILSSSLYYIPKSNLEILMNEENNTMRYYVLNRGKKYVNEYCDRIIDNKHILTLNTNILHYYTKTHLCLNDFRDDWNFLPIKIFKFMMMGSTIDYWHIINGVSNNFMTRDIKQIIILSSVFRFNFYINNYSSLSLITANDVTISTLSQLNYLRLLIRKRTNFYSTKVTSKDCHISNEAYPRNRIKLMEGNLMEQLLYKILLILTSKNIGKIVLYFV